MRLVFFILLACLGVSAQTCSNTGLGNGVVCVQNVNGTNSSSKPVSASFGATPTVGNKVILVYRISGTVSSPSCSDNQGNTYTINLQTSTVGSRTIMTVMAPITTSSGTFTVSCTQTGAITDHAFAAVEVSGVTSVDSGIKNSANGSTTGSHSSGTATPSTATSLLVGTAYMPCTSCTMTAGTSFTKVAQTASTSNTLMMQMRTVTTSAAYSSAFTDSQGFGTWISGIQAYIIPAASGSLRRRGTWF